MTATLKIRGDRYYAIVSYKEGNQNKQKWIALGIPVKNNKRKAEAMLEQIKREFEESYSTPGGDTLFVVYLRRWLDKKKSLIEQSTAESYESYAENHIIPYFEPLHLTLRDLKPQHIKDYYEHKYREGRLDGKAGGLSIASIKKHRILIQETLQDAVLAELVTRNVANGVRLPAKESTKLQYVFLDAEQANQLLHALRGHPLLPLVYVTLYYGLRRSEVLGLKWDAVDFDRNKLSIKHTVVKHSTVIRKDTTKTQGSLHTFDLIEDVKAVLLEHKRKQDEHKALFGSKYKDYGYIFTRDDGTPYYPDYPTKGLQKVLRRAGLPMMRFHDLRHSTASILYDKGWDMKDIQIWLRHASIDVTADIYTHISNQRRADMAHEFNATFKIQEG